MRKSIVAGMALMMVLMCVPLAWAEPECGHMMMRGRHMDMNGGPMWAFNKLDLTKQQMDKMDKIFDQHKNDFKTLHKKIKEDRKALREAVTADTYNEQNIRTASKALASNMEEMAVLRGKTASEIRTILTPKQVEQLNQMRNRHQEQMKFQRKFKDMMMDD